MLAKAFEAGPEAAGGSIKETSDAILKRTGEASRDTLLAGIKAVCAVLEYDRDLLLNPEQARGFHSISKRGNRLTARKSGSGKESKYLSTCVNWMSNTGGTSCHR